MGYLCKFSLCFKNILTFIKNAITRTQYFNSFNDIKAMKSSCNFILFPLLLVVVVVKPFANLSILLLLSSPQCFCTIANYLQIKLLCSCNNCRCDVIAVDDTNPP